MATGKKASAKNKTVTKKGNARLSGRGRGLKKLSKEADKTIEKDCCVIVSALGEKAREGSISSAKLLVQLANREDMEETQSEGEPQRESLSAWLAAQPEWPGFPQSANKDAK